MCIFCLAYSLASQRWRWPASAAAAALAFLLATAVWDRFSWPLPVAGVLLLAVIGLVRCLTPQPALSGQPARPPRWDLPARMVLAAAFVLALTDFAGALGPQLSGLLSPFPVFGLVLAVFTHHQQGAAASARLLRGVVSGSLAFAGFFGVVGGLVNAVPLGWVYLLATACAAGVNILAFRVENRIPGPAL